MQPFELLRTAYVVPDGTDVALRQIRVHADLREARPRAARAYQDGAASG